MQLAGFPFLATEGKRGILGVVMPIHHRAIVIGSLAFAVAGCDAVLGSTVPGGPGSSQEGVRGGSAEQPSTSTRFRRLTHSQWEKTIADLFFLDEETELTTEFRSDPRQSGYLFEGNGEALEIDPTLWSAYQRAASQIAERVTNDSADLSAIMPANADSESDEQRAESFIIEFGARAFRRPLQKDEVQSYMALYQAGLSSYADQSGFSGGIRLVLEGMLQSPHFLYLVESSTAEVDGLIPLNGHERAVRLSYFLWGTMPDAELFAAAADGSLDTEAGVRAQAQRMLRDERARDVFVHFFDKVLDVERYEAIAPSDNLFPDVTDKLSEFAMEETRQFVEREMFEGSGTLRDLLLSTTTYVNSDLADIYGLDGTYGADFVEAALDPAERSGVLTQIGFLAAHATSRDPDPIHRGVFVAKRLSCLTKSAPPDNVPPLPDPEGKSNRQLVEEHTEAPGTSCRNCHSVWINDFGFPFESYDAVGGYRTMDGDHPVDPSGNPPIDGEEVQVGNARDLSSALADSEQYHECMAGHLIAFAQARPDTDDDQAIIEGLGELSRKDAVPFEQLMEEMAVAVSFLNRAVEEE